MHYWHLYETIAVYGLRIFIDHFILLSHVFGIKIIEKLNSRKSYNFVLKKYRAI